MTLFAYTCPKCGATWTIETDQAEIARKRLAKYQKTHKCKVKRGNTISGRKQTTVL